jgi:hypothetical protein
MECPRGPLERIVSWGLCALMLFASMRDTPNSTTHSRDIPRQWTIAPCTRSLYLPAHREATAWDQTHPSLSSASSRPLFFTASASAPHRSCSSSLFALGAGARGSEDRAVILHAAAHYPATANDALSGRGPTEHQETRWIFPAVRLNA